MAARSFPVVGDLLAFQADRLGFVTEQYRRQGDVARYRLGPYRVWQLTHPDHVHDVLVTHADRFGKSVVLQRARIILGDGLLTSEGDVHDHHRRLIQPAFHSRRITGYAEVMIDQAAATADRWSAHEPVDIHAEAVRMTLTTAGRTLLGADVDADVTTVERAVSDVLSAYKLAFLPFGGSLARLPLGPARRLRRGRAGLHGLVERVVAERASTGHDSGDLLSALVLASGDDRLDDVAIRDEAVTLLLAGHETAANTLTFAFHLLARNPAVEARVHSEVDEVLGGAIPRPDDADRLPVCRAVVAEALRLYPPSWMMGPPGDRGSPGGRAGRRGRRPGRAAPVGGASRRSLVARAAAVFTRPVAVRAGRPRTAAVGVLSVRSRPAPVYRRGLRVDRSRAGTGDHRSALAATTAC